MSTQKTLTLTEFLLARFDEDEAVDPDYGFLLNIELHESGCLELGAVERSDADCDCSGPRRWLAEVEAKRRIVADAMAVGPDGRLMFPSRQHGYVMRCLALPYADHPDYRDEWKP